MINSLVKTSFDHYGRYFFIAKIIDANRSGDKLTILDVGGFGGELEKFLPLDNITVIDIIDLPNSHKNYILGNGLNLPFKDNEFDFVVSADAFEHIPEKDRIGFLNESYRVSKDNLILAAPFDTFGVIDYEKEVNEIYRSLSGKEYSWLTEHRVNGLPKISLIKDWSNEKKLHSLILDNNNIDEWKALITQYFVYEHFTTDEGKKLLDKINNEYNRTKNQYPAIGSSYRKVIALSKFKIKEPSFTNNKSSINFSSTIPTIETMKLYIEKQKSIVSDQEYTQSSIKVGAYIPAEYAREKQLDDLIYNITSELNAIKNSRSWHAISWLRSHRFYCHFIVYLWKGINFINKKQKYKVYLYPPNLIWRISTGVPAYGRKRYEKLSFKKNKKPLISIIIPIYGKPELTINCLESLQNTKTKYTYEVIIIDDHSKGKAYDLFANIKGVKYYRNKTNSGFVLSCNKGSQLAKGQYLIFLNNDTLVSKNWLDPLINRLEKDSSIGLVGSLLIYPDNRIQEAGGIIFSDGSGWNYGNGATQSSYEYSYAREVDYCSGASIAISAKLFNSIGKFDERYIPAYYEDTDLAFSVRNSGYKVVFEPRSIVKHIEGASSGTDTTKGMKKFQPINQIKFVEKWNRVLESDHFLSPEYLTLARDRSAKKLALIIDHYVPEPDKDSGSVRMRAIIKILQELGYKITFWPQNLSKNSKYGEELQENGVEVVYGPVDFLKFSKERARFYDLVLMSRPSVAPAYIDIVKSLYNNAHIIFDTVDLSFIRLSRQAKIEKNEALAEVAEGWRKVELGLMLKTDATLVVSEEDVKILNTMLPSVNLSMVSNILNIDTGNLTDFINRSGLLFIGGFSHQPNVDAVIWFCEKIMPELTKHMPNIILRVVGSNPPDNILRLADKNIRILGFIENIDPIFKSSKLFISPLRYGAGVKGKVNQAMQFGIPVVGTSISFEGMHMENEQDCVVANSEKEFVKNIIDMYSNEAKWNLISKNSQRILKEYFSPEVAKKSLKDLINKLDA